MLNPPQHTSVLIVGAGPSGLMMAAQLLRYGIQPVVIDSKQGPTNQSKALAVQARSLEIYRQMGVVDRLLDEGKKAKGLAYYKEGEHLAELDLDQIGDQQTLYPYILLYPQSKNERLLLDFLTQAACPVYWQTSLVSLRQLGAKSEASLQIDDQTYQITCDYVIGADGAHSMVRKQMGMHFSGDTYKHKFFLADVKLRSVIDDQLISLYIDRRGFAGFFPLPETDSFRILASLPDELENEESPTLDTVLPALKSISKKDLQIEKVNWFTIYKLHHRMATQFNDGNCFLAGDAAHIHSPVGGQGMNTGLQDAYNLAWKLAAVINGQILPNILNSYAEERMPVAKQLLNTTDRVFNVVTSRTWFGNILKKYVVPRVLKFGWEKESTRNFFFKRASQIGISYRESKLSLSLGRPTEIKAGDRLPYLEIFDEKKKTKTDLHSWCAKPGFTLLTFGHVQESFLFTIAKWLTQDYNGAINFFHLPYSPANQKVFDVLQIPEGTRKAVIVRPDMHIGYLNDLIDISMMNNYLRNVVGFKTP
ncbi:FAD-dependent monooxygenase [Mucilaginibacter sp. 21P]|uniref:FAD-dependent monooxygenase n=1 Tax=Mucilaginibacter sp. 21P TaxID=2778902 RepID=UPI001C58CCD2|nr:FAD-dependent monooxygenase [Mucilaginibacter sp. 21P]QXV66568.1 FAD-dependent monooxygenase [Mucilaginibacter sp. 21P]